LAAAIGGGHWRRPLAAVVDASSAHVVAGDCILTFNDVLAIMKMSALFKARS
jgi:hypothetical protein